MPLFAAGLFHLAAFFGSVFSGLFAFLAAYVGRKAAMVLALTGGMVFIFATFYTALKLLVAALSYAIPSQLTLSVFWALWPPNADACLAAYWSAHVASAIARWHWGVLVAATSAN